MKYGVKVEANDGSSFYLSGKDGTKFETLDEVQEAIKVFDNFYNYIKKDETVKIKYEICEKKG